MKNEPNIRIKGFEGEWKECTFNNLVDRISSYSSSKSLPTVEFEDIISGENRLNKDVYSKPIHKGGIAFEKNDVLFGKLRPYLKNILFATFNGIAVGDFWVLRANESYPAFVYTLVNNKSFMDVANISSGSKMPRADWNLVSKHKFLVPSFFEQRAIATYFRHLDSLIEIADKKVASLKQVKEASLQSMFPKEGQKVPEVRFKGFEGEWKETRLGDIGNTYSGVGFPIEEQGGCTGTPFYKVSDMNNKGNETIMKSSNNYVNENQVEKHGWKICKKIPAIFFAKVGAAVLLDRKRLVLEPCLCDNNTMLYCQNKDSWDPFFCLSLFETIKLSSLSQIGTLPSYNGSAVENLYIKIPSLPEQRKIASFFVHLDKQIAIAQQRLDLLRRIKSACLNEMFV